MKRKISLILAFITAFTILPITQTTHAASENSIQSIQKSTSTGTVDFTVKITGTDGEKGKEGITAGNTFHMDTGENTEILAISGQGQSSWADQQKKHPTQTYIKVGKNFRKIQNGKIDLTDNIKEILSQKGINISPKDAEFEIGEPISLTKTSRHKITVTAEKKEEIEKKVQKFIDETFAKNQTEISQARASLNAADSITEQKLKQEIKEKLLTSNSLNQFGIELQLKIKFENASGRQTLTIDPGDSTVTGTPQRQQEKTANIAFESEGFTPQGENKISFDITGKSGTFVKGKDLSFVLPKGFEWKNEQIQNENAKITPDKNTLKIIFTGEKQNSIKFTAHIKVQKDAKPGIVKMLIKSSDKPQAVINIGGYIDQIPMPKNATIFKLNTNQYIIIKDSKIYKKQIDTAPYAKNKNTMLPIRYVAEALGIDVKYDNKTKTAIFAKDKIKVEINTNKKDSIKINGKETKLTTPIENKNNRLYIPLANIGKAFGLQHGKNLIWDQQTQTVTVIR